MSQIKGLIIKDLLQLKSYRKTLIIFVIVFTLTSIMQEDMNGIGNIITVMMILVFGMFSIATFSYDEIAKADKYILTLPLTKKDIVLSKYVLVIFSTIIGAIIGGVVSFLIAFILKKSVLNFMEVITLSLSGIFGIGFVESIQIPCIYKFGAERGRSQMFVVSAIVISLIFGGIHLIRMANIEVQSDMILNIISKFLPVFFIIITLIMYYISYKISYKIYDKKEI